MEQIVIASSGKCRALWLLFFILVIFATLNGCDIPNKGTPMKSPAASPVEKGIKRLEFKPICFGRFIVEVPPSQEIAYGRMEFDAEIEFLPDMAASLPGLFKNEIEKIESERYLLGTSKEEFPRYGEVIEGPLPGQRTILSTNQAFYETTSFVPKDQHLFVISSGAGPDENTSIPLVNKVAAILRTREQDDIPAEPGFCLNGGFIPETTNFENIEIGFRFKDFPDVHLSITTRKNQNYLNEGSTIEELMASAAEDATPAHRLWLARIDFLRRGKRTLAGWQGEEVLARLPSQENATSSHRFKFKSLGAKNDAMLPLIDIELVSGVKGNQRGAVPPSLSDDQMLALWDKLTSSIRPRPTEMPTTAHVKNVKLGAALMTGRLCPQTGWWECNDPGVLPEARRQLIKEGDKMPHVAVNTERTLWNKLAGAPSVASRAALWELASYDIPDAGPANPIPTAPAQ